jgi:spermidine synthase
VIRGKLRAASRRRAKTSSISALFFVSGCASLLFESLWFRQAHLAFGSSVWASSLVLSSFMTGVALGNAGAAHFGDRVRRPLRAYAALELVIGGLGFALVAILPALGAWMAPVFRPILESDALLQPLRFAFSFVLLLGPALAMGATLPLLVRELSDRAEDFGRVLGLLYGWNTLGAVVGASIGEFWLLSLVGVYGAAASATGLNLIACAGALALQRRGAAIASTRPSPHPTPRTGSREWRVARLLAATFVSGTVLLALEVVWLRVLLLFVLATSQAFAAILASVLAGIGLGSLIAAAWLRRDGKADRHVWWVALVAGASGAIGYAQLYWVLPERGGQVPILSPSGLGLVALLMLPVSAASGMLFSLLGKALNDCLEVPVRSAGLLAWVNTLGAAGGPILAGFALLPALGIERSLVLLCASYGVIAWLGVPVRPRPSLRLAVAPAVVFLAAFLLFPYGVLRQRYAPLATQPRLRPGMQIEAFEEGRSETLQLGVRRFLGEPSRHQLFSNGIAMAGNGFIGSRYMSLFVYVPLALHPAPRDALLISYGVGTTARSLTRIAELRSIDVVDISREILAMSELVFPDPGENSLRDARVSVHVEDGRYFLQTTKKSFDLITGEPPPPRMGNVAYLYTREYFQLAYDRLREGGLLSYWLPVDQLSPREMASIANAFCSVFRDCSLWNGSNLNWILLGSRGGVTAVDPEKLAARWRDETTRSELRSIGVETPASLGALFIADASEVARLAGSVPPLLDAFPLRIENRMPTSAAEHSRFFARFQDSKRCRERFRQSAWMRELWPADLRRETLREFRTTGWVDQSIGVFASRSEGLRLGILRLALETSDLETLPLLAVGLDPREVEIAEAKRDETNADGKAEITRAAGSLARHRWSEAARRYRTAIELGAREGRPESLAVYAHCRAGEDAAVRELRERIFSAGTAAAVPSGLDLSPGADDCWAAAWDPHWPPG